MNTYSLAHPGLRHTTQPAQTTRGTTCANGRAEDDEEKRQITCAREVTSVPLALWLFPCKDW